MAHRSSLFPSAGSTRRNEVQKGKINVQRKRERNPLSERKMRAKLKKRSHLSTDNVNKAKKCLKKKNERKRKNGMGKIDRK